MEEADFFSDDDLDHIPDNTLLELEKNAISSTQKPQQTQHQQQYQRLQRPKQIHNASSLNRSRSTNNNIPWRPPQRLTQAKPSQGIPEPPSQQFAYEEENVVNLADESAIAWSQSQVVVDRSIRPEIPANKKSTLDAETAAAFAAADAELFGVDGKPNRSNDEHFPDTSVTIQARIASLEADIAEARQAELQARRALEIKAGEITIVRANAEKERKEHDRRIQSLQRSVADDAAKHKAELEANRKEKEKMQTDNRFLQHDLAQEAERAKRLNGPAKPRVETPKKLKRSGLGDGFDDDEVHSYSPSRSRDRPKDATPKAGGKRKRSAQDSPVAALSFSKPSLIPREDSHDSVQQVFVPSVLQPIQLNSQNGDSMRYMQRLMEYKPQGQSLRVLELLSTYNLPSENSQPFSSILMASLSISKTNEVSLALQTMRSLAKLWHECLELQHHSPLIGIIDIIRFAMRQELPSRVNLLTEEIVPLCLRSLEVVTMPIVRAHLRASYSTSADVVQGSVSSSIDPDQITDLLHEICQSCTLAEERINSLWHIMDFTSSMLLLHKALPMDRVVIGLKILYTSVLKDSFGAIPEDTSLQEQQERGTVYRLTYAFFDIPSAPQDEPAYDEVEIAEFRIMVLEVLTKLCEFEHGSRLLATHTHFIGHLVRFLDEQIRKLYTLSPIQTETLEEHRLMVKTINMAMRILHFLLTTHGELIDLSEKFGIVTGGYHKFLIGMTRLAFIEQPSIFERGIDENVIDAAHSILDAFLTPEDGEAVAQALETPQASRGKAPATVDEDVMDTND